MAPRPNPRGHGGAIVQPGTSGPAAPSIAALPVADAARALGVSTSTLWHWVRGGQCPVVRHGGRGPGHCTLVDPEAVRAWRVSEGGEQLALALAAELPQVLAEAMAEAHALATGVAKAPLAGVLAGTWYLAASRALDALRVHAPATPELTTIPAAIERLREIARP